MTESDALKKWCPFARHTADIEGNFHTTNGRATESFQSCIGAECMAWRKQWFTLNIDGKGYCGLSRK